MMTEEEHIFNHLNYDSILNVLSFLNPQELGRLAQVSQDSNNLASDQVVWRDLCKELEHGTWKQLVASRLGPYVIQMLEGQWKTTFAQERQKAFDFTQYVGQWNEKWCDVNVAQSTTIETDGNNFYVTYQKNKFSARFLKFEGGSLSFHLEGGDSGWSFVYTLKPLSEGVLHLHVFRVHDKESFTGVFTRQ